MSARLAGSRLEDAESLAGRADALREEIAPLAGEDAAAYSRVLEAQRSGGGMREALSEAADIPLRIAEAGTEVADIAVRLADEGNPSLRGDAVSAVLLAAAATRAAAGLVGINLPDGSDERAGRAEELSRGAAELSRRATGGEG